MDSHKGDSIGRGAGIPHLVIVRQDGETLEDSAECGVTGALKGEAYLNEAEEIGGSYRRLTWLIMKNTLPFS
jgi:hypothetical protein